MLLVMLPRAGAATLVEKACCHPTVQKLAVQAAMQLFQCVLPLRTRLTLASSRIRRCSGHGDFKTATTALLALLNTASTLISCAALPEPMSSLEPYIIIRKADKAISRMLQYLVCNLLIQNRIGVPLPRGLLHHKAHTPVWPYTPESGFISHPPSHSSGT